MPDTGSQLDQLIKAVRKLTVNDLPHVQAKLNYMDVRLARIEANISWCMKLLIGLGIAGFSLGAGVLVKLVVGI
jgi:pimeloyl-CoA synthetase